MPDLPGFGGEPVRADIASMDDYARFVLERAPREAVFAGLSMGGYVCFAIARLAPERIRGLILLDTRETADTPEARQGRYDTIEKVRREGVGPVVDSMLPKMLTASAPDELRRRVREIMSSSPAEGVMAALRAMAERPDSSSHLPSIAVPALIVVGEQDSITPPADAERMARAIPGATLERIAGAAHLANMEKASDVNRAIQTWLEDRI